MVFDEAGKIDRKTVVLKRNCKGALKLLRGKIGEI